MKVLNNKTVVSTAVNLPGPKACRVFAELGAHVYKVEPPGGDPLMHFSEEWFQQVNGQQEILSLNLKEANDQQKMVELLSSADLFLCTSLNNTLEKLKLDWTSLHQKFAKLNMLQILAYKEDENRPGHDLNLQLQYGLFKPPQLPRLLAVDYLAAERAVSTGLALMLSTETQGQLQKVYLEEAAKELATPLKFKATTEDGLLGGGTAVYGVYKATNGWVSLAALEPHFIKILQTEMKSEKLSRKELNNFFRNESIEHWSHWGKQLSLPLSVINSEFDSKNC